MSAKSKHMTSWMLLFALLCGVLPPVQAAAVSQTADIGSLADSFTSNDTVFSLTDTGRIFVVASSEPMGTLLETAQLIQRQFAADGRPSENPISLEWGSADWITDGDVVLRLDSTADIGSEGYRLEVTAAAIITAGDCRGLLYGANTLLKHFRSSESNSIRGFSCQDVPDTKQRVVSLDCGRKYYSKDWICNFIREISWMGYNTLELHFSDDSGFRIDIWDEDYYTDSYCPANDFSWICGSNYTAWTLSAYQNDPDQGKYLTAGEVVEILNTARDYHIDVIPAFDSPSHLDYMTWTYEQNYKSDPQYSFYSTYDSKTYYAADVNGIINYTDSSGWSMPLKWPYYSAVNVMDAQAKAFVFELYLDIADFFKSYADSEDFSIGADEVNLSVSNLASGYSFTWEYSDFVDYINELNRLLNGKGYTTRMFNDFIGSTSYSASGHDYADNIEILYWDSPFSPNSGGSGTKTEAVSYYVDKGATLYNCIQTNTYYVLRISGSGSDARSVYNRQWTFYHSNEEDIYNEWYPADISEHGDYSEDVADVPVANLGGAYFLIWCDYASVSTEAEIWNGCDGATSQNTGEFYSLRDRMWSNIIKMWNWDIDDTVAYSDFAAIRDDYGDFPGCGISDNACSDRAVLPASTDATPVYAYSCTWHSACCRFKVNAESSVMTLPCDADVASSSICIGRVAAGEVYTAVAVCENTKGDYWFKFITKGSRIGYINGNAVDHQWRNGVCCTCQDLCDYGYQEGKRTECAITKAFDECLPYASIVKKTVKLLVLITSWTVLWLCS